MSAQVIREELKISEESIREIEEEYSPPQMQDDNNFLNGFPILSQMMQEYKQK